MQSSRTKLFMPFDAMKGLNEALKREERPSVLYILLDGEIKNDKTFQISLKRLESLSKICYTRLVLIPIGHLRGEGYQLLSKICMKGNQ